MIINVDIHCICVRSFTNDDQHYEVTLTQENEMKGCSCPDHSRSATACKHMVLINKVHRIPLPLPEALPLPIGVSDSSAAPAAAPQDDPVHALRGSIER